MNHLTRKGLLFAAALLLAVIFALTMGETRRACATCGSVRHTVNSETTDRQTSTTKGGVTTTTEDITIRSEVRGDQGDVFTENSTYHKNADGSSADHEELHNEDPQGCYDENGESWKGDITVDDTTDPQGNRKRHVEEIIEKDGKCIKSIRDWEWDRNGKPIKDTGWKDTEVPCARYNLEYTLDATLNSNGVSMHWGPDTAIIPLGLKDGVYTGIYEGNFTATYSGKCSGTQTYPTKIKVEAKEDEYGVLKFSMTIVRSMTGMVTCGGQSVQQSNEPETLTRTFALEIEDGATYVENIPAGPAMQWTETFILKKR